MATATGNETLEARALRGDRAAWDALIRQHNRRVVVALLATGVPVEQAKELAQEAWLRLVAQQRADKLAALRLPALAVRQARFLALDAQRRRKATRPLEEAAEAADDGAGVEERVLSRQQLARALAALRRCGQTAQGVFRRVYGPTGMTARRAAEELGISHQRAKQALTEARAQMRCALEDDHGDA